MMDWNFTTSGSFGELVASEMKLFVAVMMSTSACVIVKVCALSPMVKTLFTGLLLLGNFCLVCAIHVLVNIIDVGYPLVLVVHALPGCKFSASIFQGVTCA